VIAVTLYSRPGCHLCDDMKAVVARVAQTIPMAVDEIDISTDLELERRYGEQVPVLLVDGRPAAKGRIDDESLLRILAARGKAPTSP
jgi:glutaredoxin